MDPTALIAAAIVALSWLQTNHPEIDPVPAYEIVIVDEVRAWHMGNPGVPFPENPADGRVLGLAIEGVVYLNETLPIAEDREWVTSVIVHELVHVAQFNRGDHFECAGAAERPAYEIQMDYLASVGVNIWDHIDPLYTMLLMDAGCGSFPYAEDPSVNP